MQEVSGRTHGRRWQIRLFFRAASFFVTGQRCGFGLVFVWFVGFFFGFFFLQGLGGGSRQNDGDCRGACYKIRCNLAVRKSCFRLQAADDQWCCWQICFQLAAVSPEGQFQHKAHCSGGTARGFPLLWAKDPLLPGSTSEKESWRWCGRDTVPSLVS